MILLLLACGTKEPLDQPAPPPAPPATLVKPDPELIAVTGVVSDVHPPTRSFVLSSQERRAICVLAEQGTVEVDGVAATVNELVPGREASVQGRGSPELVIVSHAVVAKIEPPAPSDPAPSSEPAPPSEPTPAPEPAAPPPG